MLACAFVAAFVEFVDAQVVKTWLPGCSGFESNQKTVCSGAQMVNHLCLILFAPSGWLLESIPTLGRRGSGFDPANNGTGSHLVIH